MKETTYDWYLDLREVNSSCYYKNAFNEAEIALLNSLIAKEDLMESFIGAPGSSKQDTKVRDSDIFFLPSSKTEYAFVFQKCVDYIMEANKTFFQAEVDKIQNLQYTVYNKGQYYGQHMDMLAQSSVQNVRKISFSVQLTDPTKYEGGDLLIQMGGEQWAAPRDFGSITFFPSYMMHKVTPITKGERRSLVGWVSGPKWK